MMMRGMAASSEMESCAVSREVGEVGGAEYCGSTTGRDWKKPDVRDDG